MDDQNETIKIPKGFPGLGPPFHKDDGKTEYKKCKCKNKCDGCENKLMKILNRGKKK